MAQFILAVFHHEGVQDAGAAYADEAAQQAAFAAVGAFNQSLQESGAWVFACGLTPPETATTVDATGGDVVTSAGPLASGPVTLGGFWVIDAADQEAALAYAAEASRACGQRIEVRALAG